MTPLGIEPDGRGMEVSFRDEDKAMVRGFLEENVFYGAPVVVLHAGCDQTMKVNPGTSTAKRIWPISHWVDPVRYRVREIECVLCKGQDIKCTYNICMRRIEPREVYQALSN